MRVLMVSDVYFPRVNGVSTSIATFRNDLASLGCASWLVAPRYTRAWEDDERVLRQESWPIPFDVEDRMAKPRSMLRCCLAVGAGVDVIHIQTPFVAHWAGIRAARELGIPAIETYHTFFEEYLHHYVPLLPASLVRAFTRHISRRQCNAVDSVIAPSRQLADVLIGYGVEREPRVIPTGLNLDEFSGGDGAAFRRLHGIDMSRPVMLLVGRVAHEKNIGFLLRVLGAARAAVPNVLLVIAGEGPALASQRFVRRLHG
jgi:1,2-diacylglycerol 3-alpha-glucosyltransferase